MTRKKTLHDDRLRFYFCKKLSLLTINELFFNDLNDVFVGHDVIDAYTLWRELRRLTPDKSVFEGGRQGPMHCVADLKVKRRIKKSLNLNFGNSYLHARQ